MARLVALLRGINVGGHRRVPMVDLREVARGIGFRDVATCVQSGNVVFTAEAGAEAAGGRLEAALEKRFGFPVDVVARTAAQWAAYVAGNPFPGASAEEPGRVLLLLSRVPPRAGGVEALAARAAAGERVEAAGGAVWVHFPRGVGSSKLAPALIDRLLGSRTTGRNWRTVLALRALLDGAP